VSEATPTIVTSQCLNIPAPRTCVVCNDTAELRTLLDTGYNFTYYTILLAPVSVMCKNQNINGPIYTLPANVSDTVTHTFENINISWPYMTIRSLYTLMYVNVVIRGALGLSITGDYVSISNLTVNAPTALFAYSSGDGLRLTNVTSANLLEIDAIGDTTVYLNNVSGQVFASNLASPLSGVYVDITPGSLPPLKIWCMLTVTGNTCSGTNDILMYPFGTSTFNREVVRMRPPCPRTSDQKSTTGVYVGIGILVAILIMFIVIFIIHHCTTHDKQMID